MRAHGVGWEVLVIHELQLALAGLRIFNRICRRLEVVTGAVQLTIDVFGDTNLRPRFTVFRAEL